MSTFNPKVTRSLIVRLGSKAQPSCLVEFEPGTFQFLSKHLIPLGHSNHSVVTKKTEILTIKKSGNLIGQKHLGL